MLETLRIQNFALIDEVELEFGPGFNVITGETGAGKSILMGALNLVLGARASADVVRQGAKRAQIEGVFRPKRMSSRLRALLKEREIELEDGELILSRAVGADGRSRAYVGGSLVPVSILAELGDELVDLHGQHEHQSLLKADRQLDLVDAYGAAETLVQSVVDCVASLRVTEAALRDIEADDRERERRVDFLKHEVNEIEQAALVPGEEEELRSRRNIIGNSEKIVQSCAEAYAALYEDEGSAIERIGGAISALEELADIAEDFQQAVDKLSALHEELAEIAARVREYTSAVEFDADELEQINQRLAMIGGLRRKFGDSVEVILAYHAKALVEIEAFERRDEHIAKLKAERDKLLKSAMEAATALSDKRRKVAVKLDKRVAAALQELGMKGGKFETRFEETELTSQGLERVEFLLSANPGEKLKPLRQVASGGEVSRVMLALKTVFADADNIPTLVFDEIDAGVGGAIASKVAERIRELTQSHQTLCITHLPQIAAVADVHFCVAKSTTKGRTASTVQLIQDEARVQEVARLLDGTLSDLSVEHARALLSGNSPHSGAA